MDKHSYFTIKASQFDPMKHIQRIFEVFEQDLRIKPVIIEWKRVFRKVLAMESYPPAPPVPEIETYSLIVGYDTGSFEYLYNLNTAKSILDARNLVASPKPIKTLMESIDQENVHAYERTPHDNPIIIIHSPIFDRPVCINGNHRIKEAFQRHEKNITCYELFGDEHVLLMDNRISKAMYLMTMDVYRLSIDEKITDRFELYINRVGDFISLGE